MSDNALDVVQLCHYKANELGKPYGVVLAPSGNLIAVPMDQCKVETLEVVWPADDYPYESKS